MTGRERVRAAMRREPVDRVPVMCQLALGHYFLHGSAPPSEIWFDSEVFVRTLIEFQQRYRFDGILINLPGRPPDWRSYLQSSQSVERGEELIWKDGLRTFVPADDNPQCFAADGGALARADYESTSAHDPGIHRLAGYVWNTWHAPSLWNIAEDADLGQPEAYPAWLARGLELARAGCPDVSVHMEVFSPFTHLLELLGYEQALMALIEAPERCKQLLGVYSAVVAAQIERYAACDPDAILISSAFAGAGFIGRGMYEEFVLPYEQRAVMAVHRRGISAYVHTCGAIGDRLDLMAETGVDGIDTLDPPPLGTVELAEAKAQFGDRLFFKGNLDAVNEMLRADDATFAEAVKQRLAVGKPGSGFILSSACSVAPHVKPERLKLMVDLAEAFG